MDRHFLPIAAMLVAMSACAPTRNNAPDPPGLAIPTESELSKRPALARAWANRVQSDDPAVHSDAVETLVQAGERSVPLLKHFLHTRDEQLHAQAMEIVHRLGPHAIGLLTEMLGDRQAEIRWQAIDLLVDLAPDTESIQPALSGALDDDDVMVARDAARALGALGERAAPSVSALVGAFSHQDPHVRLYAAEALASIGPAAAPATMDLVRLLDDPVSGVRWGACEALASMGPAAAAAVPGLIQALDDESYYVRICAAGALGSIGPLATAAIEPLRTAAKDLTVRSEVDWALRRIEGNDIQAPADANPSVGTTRPALPATQPALAGGNPPIDWDIETGKNIVWSVELGQNTFGRPVLSDGVVYVGSDNSAMLNSAYQKECGVLLALRAADGAFLWQDLAPRVNRGLGEFLLPSTTSAPYVDGNRLYYVTAECQLRCLDTQGFGDRENDGSYQSEMFADEQSADIVWELDMCQKLGVFPHEASNSEVLPLGDLLIVATSNGRNEGHTRVPSPRAPSLIAVDRHTGHVVWRAIGPGENVLHGQWCSPTAAMVGQRTQVLFGGGDGWLRGYDAETGREIWRFDGNPNDARWLPRPGVFSRNGIVGSPVYEDGRVFIVMGDDPSHGNGPSLLHAISPNGQGDVTDSRRLWTSTEVGRAVSAPVVKDGLVYVGDLGGRISCLDAATGKLLWKHETRAAIWGCMLLAGDRLYAGNTNGVMTVLRQGRTKDVLAQAEMDASLYSRPALVGDTLYVASARRLYLIATKP